MVCSGGARLTLVCVAAVAAVTLSSSRSTTPSRDLVDVAQTREMRAAPIAVPHASSPISASNSDGRHAAAISDQTVVTPDQAAPVNARARQVLSNLPMRFEANRGQTAEQVRFVSRGPGYTVFLTPTEAVMALRNTDSAKTRKSAVVRMKLVGANSAPQIVGVDELPGKSNYFIGNDPSKWRADVPTYSGVRYREVYPGVDLVYHGNQRQFEYDFVIAPGADLHAIKAAFTGAEQITIDNDGDLILKTSGGDIRQQKPFIYQEVEGVRHEVAGSYVLLATRSSIRTPHSETLQIGFDVGDYDHSIPLVIDPTLIYSTYLGGTGNETSTSIAVDDAGNAYVAGYTNSFDFPVSSGAYQTTQASDPALGNPDGYITKLDPTGALVYSTYLGGSCTDIVFGVAVNAAGEVYLGGHTGSGINPQTASPDCGPLQNPFVEFPQVNALQTYGGTTDAFVAKLSAAGNNLLFSSFLGGSFSEFGRAIAVDTFGAAYIAGETISADYPTAGGLQAYAGGEDVFVTKVDTNGALVYSTYLGGGGLDSGRGITVDGFGNAYVTGLTNSGSVNFCNIPQSSPFPTTAGAFQESSALSPPVSCPLCCNGPNAGGTPVSPNMQDAFVTKLNSTGTELVYSTYLGGGTDAGAGNGAFEEGHAIALDSAGNAYVTGTTAAANFPTMTPFQATNDGGPTPFVTKLNPEGSGLVYSTYLGSSAYYAAGNGIAVDALGLNAHVAGTGAVPQVDPLPLSGSGAFVTKFSTDGTTLVYSTGIAATSTGAGIGLDSLGNAYVTGDTQGGLQTVNAAQPTYGGFNDAFVVKIGAASADVGLCGNGVQEVGETCDDGNTVSGDGCSATCQTEVGGAVCGNGFVETGEQCDDGNLASGDGCSEFCTLEASPGPVCGNGLVEPPSEQCDDGNLIPGDGCSELCQDEVSACVPPPAGLLAWWRFENNTNDTMGPPHEDGILQGGAAYVPGMVGQALSLDGVDDYVDVSAPVPAALQLQDFTIDAWIKPTASPAFASYIAGFGQYGYAFGIDNSGAITGTPGSLFLTKTGASAVPVPTDPHAVVPLDGQWHHVAVTKLGPTVTFFIDGVPVPPVIYPDVFTFNAAGDGTDFAIGTNPIFQSQGNPVALYALAGLVDEVEVFNRALDPSEVQAIYAAGSAGKCVPGGPIAFASNRSGNREIYTIQPDGSLPFRVTNLAGEDFHPSWSPDRTQIVFTHQPPGGGTQMAVANADGSGTPTLLGNPAWDEETPAWSPDGMKIAFTSRRDGNAEIYVMNADGTNPINLTNTPNLPDFSDDDYGPTWSPDGTKIAFVSKRDGPAQIYVMNANGTGQMRVSPTVTGFHDQSPDWAPGPGTQIAFQRHIGGNHEIYVMNTDGSGQTQLTFAAVDDQSPSWSPDGTQIVFASGTEIFVMTLGSPTPPTNITNNPAWDLTPDWGLAAAGPPDLCPDDPTKTEAGQCGCGVPDTDSDGDGTADCIEQCDFDSSKTAPGICGCGVPDTDADGDGTMDCNDACPADPAKLAAGICGCGVPDSDLDGDGTADCLDLCPSDVFKTAPGQCGCGVTDVDTDGDGVADCSDNCLSTANPDQADSDSNGVGDACDAPAPGGTGRVAFTSYRDGNAEIYVMNPDGTGQTNITNHAAYDDVPAWSPNGSRLAFVSDRAAAGNHDIYVMNADGSGATRLTTHGAVDSSPTWSPDGTQIAFVSTRDGTYQIYVMNAATGEAGGLTQLTFSSGGNNFEPAWSIGNKIVFRSNRDGNAEIYAMGADGSSQTRLTNNPAADEWPVWSPDGAQIVFHTNRDGNDEVYVMDAFGSSQTRLTNVAGSDRFADWSPDGTRIVFRSNRDGNPEIYVMAANGSFQTRLTNITEADEVPAWGVDAPACIPTPEVCNGIDDDCDGTTDEDYAPQPTSCGITGSACYSTGTTSCVDGTVIDSCTPGTPTDEMCNGVDDDCDGTTDEQIAPVPTNCGVGACGATGELSCQGGMLVDSCTPGTPAAAEMCNGIDDDCNGATDDNATPVDDNNACTMESCNAATGETVYTPVNAGDNNACTIDSCDPATGVSHAPVNPDDGNACTVDSCDPATGISHTPVNADDNNACTVDSCDPATGVSNTPINPDDGNACTEDVCDPATGQPVHTPDPNCGVQFIGPLPPYNPPPRAFRIPSTVPLKWQYAQGGTVVDSANANPLINFYGPVSCSNAASDGEAVTIDSAGDTGYRYHADSQTWQFNLETRGLPAACYYFTVTNQGASQTHGPFVIELRR